MQFRGGMNELMRQAARMQRKIEQVKEEIKDQEHAATSAGDKVKVTATCEGKISRIEVDPEFLKPKASSSSATPSPPPPMARSRQPTRRSKTKWPR